jgi:hypothetical protein
MTAAAIITYGLCVALMWEAGRQGNMRFAGVAFALLAGASAWVAIMFQCSRVAGGGHD